MYLCTKTYTPGFSCAFRQWRANHSHCSYIHGYALKIKFTFTCLTLDDKNWVVDFGGLKELKLDLEKQFDHTTCVAHDDPDLRAFVELHDKNIIDLRVMESVGCERFAYEASKLAQAHLVRMKMQNRVQVYSAEVFEHEANSAIYMPDQILGSVEEFQLSQPAPL